MKFLSSTFFIASLFVLASCGDDDVNLSFDDQLAKDIEIIDSFLDKEDIEVDIHSSGIRYVMTQEGTGNKANLGDIVNVKYRGYFLNGKEFDSSSSGISFPLTGLIESWRISIPLLREGGKITFYSPSGYCYGPSGTDGIGPNKVLAFDIELVSIQ